MAEKKPNKPAEDDAMSFMNETIVSGLISKAKPLIKPATKKFSEFMNDGNLIMIKPVKGEVHVFWIKTKDVEDFKLKDQATPAGVYKLEDFVEKILSGDFSDL